VAFQNRQSPTYAARGGDRPFDWDRYHARQNACRKADRIARGVEYCDELALPPSQARLLGLWTAGPEAAAVTWNEKDGTTCVWKNPTARDRCPCSHCLMMMKRGPIATRSAPTLIRTAKQRQKKAAEKGKPTVAVELTAAQLRAKLAVNNYRCALTGLKFWDDDGGSYGPTWPSLDRIVHRGPYNDENTRVVLLGINALRGEGSDKDEYRIAKALAGG